MTQPSIDLQAALSQHGPMLARVARALVRDEHSAEDLVQETWARAAATAPRARPAGASDDPDGARGWLLTTMKNVARSAFRRGHIRDHAANRTGREMGPDDLATQSAADTAERLEAMGLVHAALTAVEEPLRTTLQLRFHDGLSSSAIAKRMGVAPSTVRSRIQVGLDALKSQLDADFGGATEGRKSWCAALLPLARLGTEAVAPPAVKSLATWKGAAALLLLGGGGALGVQQMIQHDDSGSVPQGDSAELASPLDVNVAALDTIEAPAAADSHRVAAVTPRTEPQSRGAAAMAPEIGPHLIVVNPDGVPLADFPMGLGTSIPQRNRNNTSPESGPRTDAYGRLPLFKDDGISPIAQTIFANAPLVPLVALELNAATLERAGSGPLRLEVPHTASVTVKILDVNGAPWSQKARIILRRPLAARNTDPGDLASWIDFQSSTARFPHVGTGKSWRLAVSHLGDWRRQSVTHPALTPGEERTHTFQIQEQRIILVGDAVDVRGHPLPSIRLMAKAVGTWSRTAEASRKSRVRIPLIEARGGEQVELIGISRGGSSWNLVGTVKLPAGLKGGEYDAGSIVLTSKVTVAGTMHTAGGLPVVHQFIDIVQQAENGLWERSGRSAMAGKDGHFSFMNDVEDTSRPLAFYQFDPVGLGDDRYLIEAPIAFERGAKNLQVIMTKAVALQGRIVIPEGIDDDDLSIVLSREGCPNRIINEVRRNGSFKDWAPMGPFNVEVHHRQEKEPMARIEGVYCTQGDPAPAVLQAIVLR